MAEEEAEHRRSIELDIVAAGKEESVRDSNEARRGQVFAFLIAIAGLAGAVYTALQGHEITGGIIGVGAIGSIVTTFIVGRSAQHRDDSQPENPKKPPVRKKKKSNRTG